MSLPKYLRYFDLTFEDILGKKYCQSGFFSPGFIIDLFALEFKRCSSKGVAKLLIYFTEDATKHLKSQLLLEVLYVNVYFDLVAFSQLDFFRQKQFFLECIYKCLINYADKYGWDREHCEKIYRKILKSSITFDRMWGKPVKSRTKGFSAQIHARYFNTIDLSIVIIDKENTPIRTKLIATLPGAIGALWDACGKLVWQDDHSLRLYRENLKDFWEYDLLSDEVRFFFARAENGDAHGQYDLGVMYLEGYLVFPDHEKAVYWLRLAAEQKFRRAITRLAIIEEMGER